MVRQAYTEWVGRAGGGLIFAGLALAAASNTLAQAPVAAMPAPLVVLVDTGTEMPMAGFRDGQLVDGIHHDLGVALAQKLGRQAIFTPLPRKRIVMALEAGQADLICMYLPAWLPGKFQWTHGFYPVSEVVVTDTTARQPRDLRDLSGQPVATVLGYYYPEFEQALGSGFVRDDGPSSSSNLRKMAAGRLHHAITQRDTLDYFQKIGGSLSVHPPLLVKTYMAKCAVAEQGHVKLAEVDKAISQLVKDGDLTRIIGAYQSRLK